MRLSAPELLSDRHILDTFCSGVPPLDQWLKRRARTNQLTGASRTYVVCEESRVVGYYALAAGAIAIENAPGRFRRNMPDPIPVVLLGRLAVDESRQKQGLGGGLLRDAIRRVFNAAAVIGVRGILVHAISDEARSFYLAQGFEPSAQNPMTLMIALGDVQAVLGTSVEGES